MNPPPDLCEETNTSDTLILGFWTPELCGNNFCWCEPPHLWQFVMTALGNKYRLILDDSLADIQYLLYGVAYVSY